MLTIAAPRRPTRPVSPSWTRSGLPLAALAVLGTLLGACAGSAPVAETAPVVSGIPFVDGERYVYRLVDRDGVDVGTGTFTTGRDDDTWVLTQTYENDQGVVVDESIVVVDAETLQPRTTERVIAQADEVEVVAATYEDDGDGARTVRATHVDGEDERTRTIEMSQHDYEDQSSLWLWRTLALGEGLDARYTTVDPREGGRVTANVMQVDRQTLETPVGAFDTWVLQIRTGRETVNVWV
ncbi:MAG: DUF3108 domain-containing protein, partial [Chloroflexi bacterium]|nr:DUF3108 domain-containing protein [Chloroflexota bacterium]